MIFWIVFGEFEVLKISWSIFGNIKHPSEIIDHGVFQTKTQINPRFDPGPKFRLIRDGIRRNGGIHRIFQWAGGGGGRGTC